MNRRRTVIASVLALSVIFPLCRELLTPRKSVVVLYCAHDSIFAEEVIRRFEESSGIQVHVRYDEETNKSLGLTSLLLSERDSPRCDVFWNNQTLGTIRLKEAGVLEVCDPSLFSRIPEQFRDADNTWAGFAARLRVYIINTELLEVSEPAVRQALMQDSLSSVAIAVPLFGTTLSHYTVLCEQTGLDGLKLWHQSLHQRGIREARSNGAVKDLVAEGACKLGFTDTDDAFVALDAGKPVDLLPVRLESGQTIVIPNSVCVIRNCPHPAEAGQLVEFLLSEETEIALARSASRQIPLGPVASDQVSDEVRRLSEWAHDAVSMERVARHDAEVLAWLTGEYAGKTENR